MLQPHSYGHNARGLLEVLTLVGLLVVLTPVGDERPWCQAVFSPCALFTQAGTNVRPDEGRVIASCTSKSLSPIPMPLSPTARLLTLAHPKTP